jgi:hypothetical protein
MSFLSEGISWATLIDDEWNGGGNSSGSWFTVEPEPSGKEWHMWQPLEPSATLAIGGMS